MDVPVPYKKRMLEEARAAEKRKEQETTAKRARENPPESSSASSTSTQPSRPTVIVANAAAGEPQAKRAKVVRPVVTSTRAEEVFFGDHRGLFCNAESIERLLAVIAAFGWGRWECVAEGMVVSVLA